MQEKTVDITPLFQATRIPTDAVSIIETPGMYPYKTKLEDNWAYYTAIGLTRLREIFDKENFVVKDIGIVGICSGVEAIAIVEIFKDTAQSLAVTDIDAEILEGTIRNISGVSNKYSIPVTPLIGSFCEPIDEAGLTVDLVHANIPNLPALGTEDLTKGAEKGTFLPAQLYEGYNPPTKFVGWAMGAQYAYLESAKRILKDGGTIITELGGRMPLSLVQDLFDAVGLRLQEFYVGFKEQTEALIDFIGYHRMETQYGVTFEFYRYDESKKMLADQGYTNIDSRISGAELKRSLEPFKVSAGEALELHKKGMAIGHTVHLFRGMKL